MSRGSNSQQASSQSLLYGQRDWRARQIRRLSRRERALFTRREQIASHTVAQAQAISNEARLQVLADIEETTLDNLRNVWWDATYASIIMLYDLPDPIRDELQTHAPRPQLDTEHEFIDFSREGNPQPRVRIWFPRGHQQLIETDDGVEKTEVFTPLEALRGDWPALLIDNTPVSWWQAVVHLRTAFSEL
jgi:hypothetical protein